MDKENINCVLWQLYHKSGNKQLTLHKWNILSCDAILNGISLKVFIAMFFFHFTKKNYYLEYRQTNIDSK